MAKYTETEIIGAFEKNLDEAQKRLAGLPFFCDCREPEFKGLSGWVFEQTIQFYLRRELEENKLTAEFREQESLGGRAKVDLLVGAVALELKAGGLFGTDSIERYGKYRAIATRKGYSYLYLTLQEGHRPYRDGICRALGKGNAFFLDTSGHWNRLVKRVTELLKQD